MKWTQKLLPKKKQGTDPPAPSSIKENNNVKQHPTKKQPQIQHPGSKHYLQNYTYLPLITRISRALFSDSP